MARERPITSNDEPSFRPADAIKRSSLNRPLSRAEARALTRCAPLTRVEFKSQRDLAEQRVFPPQAGLSDVGDEPPAQQTA